MKKWLKEVYCVNRRIALLLSLSLILVIVGSLIFYIANSQSILWQNPGVAGFAKGFTVADGKIFVTNNAAYVQCFDENTGQSIWNTSLHSGDYGGSPQVTAYEGKLYASTGNQLVKRLNEDTGVVEMEYQAPLGSPSDYKFVPSFFIADGKVFATAHGTAVYDAITGYQLWTDSSHGLIVNDTSNTLPKSNFAYVTSYVRGPVVRRDPNNGKLIWIFLGSASGTLISQDQVVVWNYAAESKYQDNGNTTVCLDINTGKEKWRFDAVRSRSR